MDRPKRSLCVLAILVIVAVWVWLTIPARLHPHRSETQAMDGDAGTGRLPASQESTDPGAPFRTANWDLALPVEEADPHADEWDDTFEIPEPYRWHEGTGWIEIPEDGNDRDGSGGSEAERER